MEFLVYLLKSSLLLFLFWAIYKILLERETYHFIKRVYLMSGLFISAFLPLIYHTTYENLILNQQAFVSKSSQFEETINSLTWWEEAFEFMTQQHLIEITYISVSVIILGYFMFNFLKLTKSLRASEKITKNGIHYIKTSKNEAFSFLNYIVYNPDLYTEKEVDFILKHEKAHVHKKHSFDTILIIIYKSIFWINPIAWLYKKDIAQNLEFEADAEATTETNCKAYQYSLYKMTSQNYILQQSFKQSSLKKRIMMLNTNTSKNSIWKVFMITPFLFSYFMLFQTETKAQVIEATKIETDVTFIPEAEITRVTLTYDEKSTLKQLKEDITFIKDSFDIDINYSRLKQKSGFITAMKLKAEKGGNSSSVYSNNLKENPIYFYYDKSNKEDPFGVGTGEIEKEQNEQIIIEKLENAQYITINSERYNRDKLIKKTISVKDLDYNEDTKTIHITSDPELSQAIYEESARDLFKIIEKESGSGIIENKKFLIISEKPKPTLLTINKLSISNSAKNASEFKNDNMKFDSVDPIYLLNGKEIDKKEMNSIDPKQIKSVNVIKDKDRIKELGYDPKETSGIIEIKTEK